MPLRCSWRCAAASAGEGKAHGRHDSSGSRCCARSAAHWPPQQPGPLPIGPPIRVVSMSRCRGRSARVADGPFRSCGLAPSLDRSSACVCLVCLCVCVTTYFPESFGDVCRHRCVHELGSSNVDCCVRCSCLMSFGAARQLFTDALCACMCLNM